MNPSRVISVLFVLAIAAFMVVLLVRSGPGTGGNPFSYDLAPYRKVDPKLVRYREEGTFAVPLAKLRALAVDGQGRVLVAGMNPAGAQLLRVSEKRDKTSRFPLPVAPHCVAVGPEGSIYVGSKDRVMVLNPLGETVGEWSPLGERAFITSIAAGRRDVYVADGGHRLVWRFGTDGLLKGMMGRRDLAAGEEGFVVPGPNFDLALDPAARLWVVDPGRHRVQHRTPEGAVVSQWGRYGFDIQGFCGC